VWESHVTWGTPVQSFVFLGFLVFELEPMYATSDGQTDRRTTDADHRLMPRPPTGRGHNNTQRRSLFMAEDGQRSMHQCILFITGSSTSRRREQNLLVRTGKSEAAINNKCIRDDTKAATFQSPNCIRKTKKYIL